MEVDIDLVKNVALLSQLKIADNDIEQTISELNQVLALADTMEAIDTDGIEPMSNPLDATQLLRADKVTETDQRASFQQNAPMVERGYYLVPRVVE